MPFAERVRKEQGPGLAVGAVGLITEGQQAEKTAAEGRSGAVPIGREPLRSQGFGQYAAARPGAAAHVPNPYHRAV